MNTARLYQVIQAPIVTEKAVNAMQTNNQFVFKVALDASKIEIKRAIEILFAVKVVAVNTVRVLGKQRKFKNRMGKRANWKKAFITLGADAKLDLATFE